MVFDRMYCGRTEGCHLSYTSGQLALNQEGSAPDCSVLLTAVAELQLLWKGKDDVKYAGGGRHFTPVLTDLCTSISLARCINAISWHLWFQ